jgi:SAM-dependent methyltransferase
MAIDSESASHQPPTVLVDAREGYRHLVSMYESIVEDSIDIELLDELTSIPWQSIARGADLGCGTGRTGRWLKKVGVGRIDGVDASPEMLAVAASTGVYDSLTEADAATTGFPSAGFQLVVACLLDIHLSNLEPLYEEAFRLLQPEGFFVLVGLHPQFIRAAGNPIMFPGEDGTTIAIETFNHPLSEHLGAGLKSRFELIEMRERFIDEKWIQGKLNADRFLGHPISFVVSWKKH